MSRSRTPARATAGAIRSARTHGSRGGQNVGGDRHALMLDKSSCTLYELYNARFGSRARAGSGAIWNLRSNQLPPAGWTSADAAGLPILPRLLNYGQVKRPVPTKTPIRHAIRFTADRTRSAYIWPPAP